jgi:hypothetical protein
VKIATIAIITLLTATPTLAQQPTDRITLSVTRAELQVIGQGLMELPYKTSSEVLGDLQRQLSAAEEATKKTAAESVKPKEETKQ